MTQVWLSIQPLLSRRWWRNPGSIVRQSCVARIHILGCLNLGVEPLLSCAEQQIPVAFFAHSGKLRCQLYFPVFESTQISHWLEHVEFDFEAGELYADWLHHQSLHLIANLGVKQGAREIRLHCFNEQVDKLCRNILGESEYIKAYDWLDGICMTHLSQIIVEQGFSNNSRGKRKLIDDLMPLFSTWLRYQFAVQLQQQKMSVNGKTMSQFYQGHAVAIDYMGRRMLSQLATRLESIV